MVGIESSLLEDDSHSVSAEPPGVGRPVSKGQARIISIDREEMV